MPSLEGLAKLLLDEDRLIILGMAARGPCSADELGAALASKRANLARHLAQLVEAGLLAAGGPAGQERYTLNVRRLQSLKATLFARPAAPKPATPEEQVLATFVRNGRIVQYPAQPSKRLVVLRWLAEQFEPGRAYSEREVNDLLRHHSEDHATLRRYLVDHGFLSRTEGVYTRTPEQPAIQTHSGV
jgi:DNA-binding transcriptional ArsR family regulator